MFSMRVIYVPVSCWLVGMGWERDRERARLASVLNDNCDLYVVRLWYECERVV